MKEPWCLVSSEPTATAKTVQTCYGQRWGIESSFRDLKDLRSGMRELRVGKPERRDRLLLISALAMALLTILGATGEAMRYDRMLKANYRQATSGESNVRKVFSTSRTSSP